MWYMNSYEVQHQKCIFINVFFVSLDNSQQFQKLCRFRYHGPHWSWYGSRRYNRSLRARRPDHAERRQGEGHRGPPLPDQRVQPRLAETPPGCSAHRSGFLASDPPFRSNKHLWIRSGGLHLTFFHVLSSSVDRVREPSLSSKHRKQLYNSQISFPTHPTKDQPSWLHSRTNCPRWTIFFNCCSSAYTSFSASILFFFYFSLEPRIFMCFPFSPSSEQRNVRCTVAILLCLVAKVLVAWKFRHIFRHGHRLPQRRGKMQACSIVLFCFSREENEMRRLICE